MFPVYVNVDEPDKSYEHFYLYAKGHYGNTKHLLEELLIINGEWSGVSPEYLNYKHALLQLLSIVSYDMHTENCQVNVNSDRFVTFIDKFLDEEFWAMQFGRKFEYKDALLQKCISYIKLINVSDIPFQLGEINSEIMKKLQDLRKTEK